MFVGRNRWYFGRSRVQFNKQSIKVMLDTITPEAGIKEFVDKIKLCLDEAGIEWGAVSPIGSGEMIGFRITIA